MADRRKLSWGSLNRDGKIEVGIKTDRRQRTKRDGGHAGGGLFVSRY